MHQEDQIFSKLKSKKEFSKRARFHSRTLKFDLDSKRFPLSRISEEDTITLSGDSGDTNFMSALQSNESTPYLSCYHESQTKKRKLGETSFVPEMPD